MVMSVMTTPRAGLVERVEAAAAAGYRGIGLRPRDRRAALEAGWRDRDLRALLDHHGIEVVEVEALHCWGCGGAEGTRARAYEQRLYELADALGGCHITATGDLDGPFDAAVERFAALCDRTATRGLTVALEFMPWTEVPNAAMAWRVASDAGRANGGVLVDSWHHFRGAAHAQQLRAVPADRIAAVQLADADRDRVGTLLDDTLHRRRLPGAGALDLVGFLRLLTDAGVRAPLCVEVISNETAAMSVAQAARISARAAADVLAAASGS